MCHRGRLSKHHPGTPPGLALQSFYCKFIPSNIVPHATCTTQGPRLVTFDCAAPGRHSPSCEPRSSHLRVSPRDAVGLFHCGSAHSPPTSDNANVGKCVRKLSPNTGFFPLFLHQLLKDSIDHSWDPYCHGASCQPPIADHSPSTSY